MTYKGKVDQIPEYEVKEGYAKYAPLSKNDAAYYNGMDQKMYLRELRNLKGLTILDAGSGEGRFVPLLKKRGATNVVALDISPEMLEEAKKTSFYTEYVEHDLKTPLPFEPETFDMVVCNFVLMHIQERDFMDLFTELYHVLKPQGKLYIVNLTKRRGAKLQDKNGDEFYITTFPHSDKAIMKHLEEAHFSLTSYQRQEEKGYQVAGLLVAEKTI